MSKTQIKVGRRQTFMKAMRMKLIIGVVIVLISAIPSGFSSVNGPAIDAPTVTGEAPQPSKPAGSVPGGEKSAQSVAKNNLGQGDSLIPADTLGPVVPEDSTKDPLDNNGTSDDYNSTMNEHANRMQEAGKLMEKWNKWHDYLMKVDMQLISLETMKQERESISKNAKKVDEALDGLLTAIGNAPGVSGMPSISQADYKAYKNRRTGIKTGSDAASGKAQTAIEDAINELKNEKANAETIMKNIQNEVSNILMGNGSAAVFQDAPSDIPTNIQDNIKKASASMAELRKWWASLKGLANEVLTRVNYIVGAYKKKGIVFDDNQKKVVAAAQKLRNVLFGGGGFIA